METEKRIGIIGAMNEEVDHLKDALQDEETITLSGIVFHKGTIEGTPVIVAKCGVGKVNAAVAAEILCAGFRVSALINTGVAGGLDSRVRIGDIVLSTDLLQHDMDVVPLGYEPGVIPDQDTSVFKADPGLIAAAKEAAADAVPTAKIVEGRIVSGDQFVSDMDRKLVLLETFSGVCVEMEGAAIAQVCHMNKTPFIVIRSISDQADNSAFMDYSAFIEIALKNSYQLIMEMLRRM